MKFRFTFASNDFTTGDNQTHHYADRTFVEHEVKSLNDLIALCASYLNKGIIITRNNKGHYILMVYDEMIE